MKIKSLLLIALVGVITVPGLQSCKKYPEDPVVSFRSRAERVSNTWVVENYKKNGNDYTSFVTDYIETFSKSGSYLYSWGILGGSGTWTFQKNDEEISLAGTDKHSSRTLIIQKLEEKSFWYNYVDGDDQFEVHLIQK